MKEVVIKVEDLSKIYRLGKTGSGRLREDFRNWWHRKAPEQQRTVEALRHISFDICRGDVLGIVGNNGSGKSTLLKILSRIVHPSSGRVHGKGRLASLLEIGTGFQGELTGRENVFLNGSILGMSNRQIKAKFDEIIAFSGVEKFIDTPVKRYSSGMYMRLAFSVAAHLESDILLLDEVLAVGDIEFQRKCLAKIREISAAQGRTIAFVSHNMNAVQQLCNRAICLDKGRLIRDATPDEVVKEYILRHRVDFFHQQYDRPENAPGNDTIRINQVTLTPQFHAGETIINLKTPLTIEFLYWCQINSQQPVISILQVFDFNGVCVFESVSKEIVATLDLVKGRCEIPGNFLNEGAFYISLSFVTQQAEPLYYFEACLSFEVVDTGSENPVLGKRSGLVRPEFPVTLDLDAQKPQPWK